MNERVTTSVPTWTLRTLETSALPGGGLVGTRAREKGAASSGAALGGRLGGLEDPQRREKTTGRQHLRSSRPPRGGGAMRRSWTGAMGGAEAWEARTLPAPPPPAVLHPTSVSQG